MQARITSEFLLFVLFASMQDRFIHHERNSESMLTICKVFVSIPNHSVCDEYTYSLSVCTESLGSNTNSLIGIVGLP